jgi:hypothetical protein
VRFSGTKSILILCLILQGCCHALVRWLPPLCLPHGRRPAASELLSSSPTLPFLPISPASSVQARHNSVDPRSEIGCCRQAVHANAVLPAMWTVPMSSNGMTAGWDRRQHGSPLGHGGQACEEEDGDETRGSFRFNIMAIQKEVSNRCSPHIPTTNTRTSKKI